MCPQQCVLVCQDLKVPIISSGGAEKIIRFLLFEFVLRVFFAQDFGIRIDEILLKRNFF